MQMLLPIAVEDVKREVKILQALKGHENVVHFHNAFEDDSYVYIVMEYDFNELFIIKLDIYVVLRNISFCPEVFFFFLPDHIFIIVTSLVLALHIYQSMSEWFIKELGMQFYVCFFKLSEVCSSLYCSKLVSCLMICNADDIFLQN